MITPNDIHGWYSTANEDERAAFRKWLKGILRDMDVKITFKKKDGTERQMNCTLKEEVLPIYEKKTDNVRDENNDVCPVFDLDKQQFRSFRFDSILKIEFSL